MPLTWMVTLTYIGYLGWRLRGLLGWRRATLLCGLLGAIVIPVYEEMAYYGGWWRYKPVRGSLSGYWWRSQFSRLRPAIFKLKMNTLSDFATNILKDGEPILHNS